MLDALTLDQIRMFVTVAEAGSFRSGAARLLRAQSAVSHAIANLESQLGVTVFDRSGHRPTLTPAGAALLEDARAVLLKVDFLRARARGLGEGVETELALMVDTLCPLPLAAAALGELCAALPSVRLRMATAPLGGTLQALRDDACDLAIMAGEDFRDPRIETEALKAVPIVAVAAASHPLARRRSKALTGADLADHLQIVLEDPSALSEGRDFGVLSPQTLRVGTGRQARPDPGRRGLGPPAAVGRGARTGRWATAAFARHRPGPAGRGADADLPGLAHGPGPGCGGAGVAGGAAPVGGNLTARA